MAKKMEIIPNTCSNYIVKVEYGYKCMNEQEYMQHTIYWKQIRNEELKISSYGLLGTFILLIILIIILIKKWQ